VMPGLEGLKDMAALMKRLRQIRLPRSAAP
jgi:hypothetical protein